MLIQRARRSAAWLHTLTENLACVAVADVQPASVDLRDCIEDAIHLVRGLLEPRRQSVIVVCAPREVLADRVHLTQVVTNLLSNASRYSTDKDTIVINAEVTMSGVRVSVTDHGPGISHDDQQRIFGTWVRARSDMPGGMGLGLSIVQDLVRRMGGEVGVESTPGNGATFWILLRKSGTLAPSTTSR